MRGPMSSQSSSCELSIVMPCLNEAETVATCVRKALRFLEQEDIAGEVVVADNGSTDGSREIAASAGARVVIVADKGYGNALMGGISSARGKYVIMGDADDSYDFLNLRPFVDKLREGCHLVMGNRFKGGIAPGAMPFLHKHLGNPVLTSIGRVFFGSPSGDFHCGLRGFSKEAFERMNLQTAGMEFASEIVVKAALQKMRIAEVPTTLSPDGRTRPPHLRSWRDGWRHLRFLLLFSPRWLFLIPGLVLFFFGGIFGALLTFSPITVGSIVFDTNTLLVCSMTVLIGFQLIFFSVFAKTFAIREKLLPEDSRIDKFLEVANLELGLLAGLSLSLTGLVLLVLAVFYWGLHHFGRLSYPDSLRLTIPGVTFIMLGAQTMSSSFFLSVLKLKKR
jgi:glycosyltransferase involved in cell wall biosynthesis